MAESAKYKVRLQFSAKDLLRSLNPVCRVLLEEQTAEKDRELLRTGPVPQSPTPTWQEHLRLGIWLWDVRRLRVEIYDTEGEQGVVIASARVSLGWLLRHASGEIQLHPEGKLFIVAELVPDSPSKWLYLKLSARNLRPMDLIGANDPFFVLSQAAVLYTSEVLDNELLPRWKPLRLPITPTLASNPLQLSLYDKDFIGSDHIGSLQTSLLELTEGGPELRIQDKAGRESGIVRVEVAKVTDEYEFVREMRTGLALEVCFGVDFGWGSGSFHTESQASNLYYRAISGVAEALESYTEGPFALVGFGGHMSPHIECQSHWSLSSTPLVGTKALLKAYFHAVSQAIYPFSSKLLSPLLQEYRLNALPNSGRYYVLVILSSGRFSDLEACKEELRLLSALPVSLLLVGIGDISERETTSLDSNSALLTSQRGTAVRDCVASDVYPSEKFPRGLLQALPLHLQDYGCLAT